MRIDTAVCRGRDSLAQATSVHSTPRDGGRIHVPAARPLRGDFNFSRRNQAVRVSTRWPHTMATADGDAEAQLYHLGCSPATVCWGYMDAAVPPRLSVPDRARVRIDCVNGGPEVLPTEPPRESLGQTEWHIPPELSEIHTQITDRVNPGHILTGPVFVEGAEPGDVLQIDIEAIDLRTNWAWTATRPYGGALPGTDPGHLRHTLLAPTTSATDPRSGAGWAFPQWGGRLGEHHVHFH